jgi:hypothetical protein
MIELNKVYSDVVDIEVDFLIIQILPLGLLREELIVKYHNENRQLIGNDE